MAVLIKRELGFDLTQGSFVLKQSPELRQANAQQSIGERLARKSLGTAPVKVKLEAQWRWAHGACGCGCRRHGH